MAIDNQFRIGELISSGSRAIVSKDEVSGNHTFTMGSTEVIDTPYEHIKGERDGELIGRIEKPKYDESELKKAVDTDVDELIGPPKKEKPDVVPRPVYEDMRNQFLTASAELAIANERIQDLESEVETLKSEIETLLIQVDALSLQTAAAQNEAQTTNDRYTLLLQDFSSAIVKSTKEGIERVSLKAQTEGLIAQKESLREQLKALNLIVGQLQVQVEQQNIRQASESALDGQPGSFDEIGNVGYKIPQGEFEEASKQLFIKTENADRVNILQGTGLNLYNFNEEETTFNISVTGDAQKFLQAPSTITLPARVDATPGVGYITFRWRPLGRTSPRKSTTSGNVVISTSTGENFSIKAEYFKEVRRGDNWDSKGRVSTNVGSEL